jgi:flagellar hook-basal body complex protein FliE
VIPPIGAVAALGPDALIAPIGGLGPAGTTAVNAAAPGTSPTSFANALSGAINNVQSAQSTADVASTQLATGQVTDPTKAITAVENAQLEMELASQVTQKGTQDVQTIFGIAL